MSLSNLAQQPAPAQPTSRPSEPWLRALPEDGYVLLLLLVAQVYITIAGIQSAGWGVGADVLTPVAALGLIFGYLSVQQRRLSGTLVQWLAIILGALIAFQAAASSALAGNRSILWAHLGVWFQRVILRRLTSTDNDIFLLFLCFLTFLLAYMSVWLVLRTRRPWLAALANGVILLINLNNTTDDRAVLFTVLFLLVTLLLMVRFTLAENIRQWRGRGLRFSPDLSWDFMQAGAIFAVVVLLLAYVLPIAQPNARIQAYLNSPASIWTTTQSTVERLFGGLSGKGNGSGPGGSGVSFFGNRLQLVGSVSLPNTVILRYQTPSATDDPTQYLITQTFNIYDGQDNWSPSAAAPISFAASTVQPPSIPSANYNVTTYNIIMTTSQAPHLFAPGAEPTSFSVPASALVDINANVPTSWASSVSQHAGFTYTAKGYTSSATTEQLRAVPYPSADPQSVSDYPTGLLNTYLPSDSPNAISPDVLALAQHITAGAPSMYDAAVLLENYLRANYTYNTSNPDPPSDQDAISWFLFHQKQGFCTYFASALALMARAIGMPTRLAAGFAAGTYDQKTNQFTVTGKEAHVWPQIYFANYGWINFEPTASFSTFARAVAITGPTPVSSTPGATGAPRATPTPRQKGFADTPGGGRATPNQGGATALLDLGVSFSLLIALALLCAALFLIWWRLLYRGLSPVSVAFARVARLGGWAGAPPRRSQTPSEYTEQLGRIIPDQRGDLRRLSDLYSRERWGGGLPPDTTDELPRLYQQTRVSLTRAIVQRLRSAPGALITAAQRARHRQRRPH